MAGSRARHLPPSTDHDVGTMSEVVVQECGLGGSSSGRLVLEDEELREEQSS